MAVSFSLGSSIFTGVILDLGGAGGGAGPFLLLLGGGTVFIGALSYLKITLWFQRQ